MGNLKLICERICCHFNQKKVDHCSAIPPQQRHHHKPGNSDLQNGTGAVNQFSATKCDLQNWFEVVLAGYHLCRGLKLKLSSIQTKPQSLGGLWCMLDHNHCLLSFPMGIKPPMWGLYPKACLSEFSSQKCKGTSVLQRAHFPR